MPTSDDRRLPARRPMQPEITVYMTAAGPRPRLGHQGPDSGVCAVSIGDVHHKIVLGGDPAVLLVLLEDAVAQLQAIATQ